jgi:hypothetical protein
METKLPSFIPKSWSLPESIRVRLGDKLGRQRLMDEDGHLLLLLHEPPTPADNEIRKPAVFWRTPEGQWKSAPSGGGLAALQAHLAAYRTMVANLDEAVEQARVATEFFEVMRDINPLLRSARNLLGVMEEARKARSAERRLIVLRDEAVEIERAAELIANEAKSGMEFALAVSGEAQAREAIAANREARRLNRLVAFFFPLATLVAIFSMNRPSLLLQYDGVIVVLLLGVALGVMVRALISKHAG